MSSQHRQLIRGGVDLLYTLTLFLINFKMNFFSANKSEIKNNEFGHDKRLQVITPNKSCLTITRTAQLHEQEKKSASTGTCCCGQ